MSKRNEQLQRLFYYISELHLRWYTYVHLFGHSDDRIKHLNRRIGHVIGAFQVVLLGYVMVEIAKLFDEPRVCGKETLTFARMLKDVPLGSRAQLKSDLKALKQQCHAIVTHRHRRLAHNDFAIAMDKEVLPGVSRKMIHEAIDGIAKFYDSIAVALGEPQAAFHTVESYTRVETFMKVIQAGNDKLDAADTARRGRFN